MRTVEQLGCRVWGTTALAAALLAGLALHIAATHGYPLFHAAVEGFGIAVAVSIWALATRAPSDSSNGFSLFLGNTFPFVALLDFAHLLTYQGMGEYPAYDLNVPTQLWIAGRFVEAVSLLLATFFLRREFPRLVVLSLYAVVTGGLLACILWIQAFPVCFVEGKGLTPFEIAGEYLVVLTVLVALLRLRSRRHQVDPSAYLLLTGAMVATILSELSLTLDSDPHGIMDSAGHLFKVLSYYLVYRGITLRSVAQTTKDAIICADGGGKVLFRNRGAEEIHGYSAEEALRQCETLYRTLVEAVDDVIHVKDAQGRYLLVNSEMARRLGRPKEEIQGKTALQLHGPVKGPRVMEEDSRVLSSGTVLDYEEEDDARVCHVRKVPLRSETGEVVGVVTVARDVTERKQMEERLLRAHRLETAGRIAGQVAHDFNNLLSPLLAYPELIKMELPPGHSASQCCDVMMEAAGRMAEINRDLLALGRRGHIAQQPADLNRLVQQAVMQMEDRPDTLAVELDLDPDLLPVAGAPAQLMRVISNLLSNAREAMQEVGVVTLKTENLNLDQPYGHYNRIEAGEYVRLTIGDTGCGIPAEIRDRIFDAFFTTKRTDRHRGSGLGLSVVQAIVEDHRGCLDLESEVGKGTTFSVYLPISREAGDETPGDPVKGGTETLMVVDDDPLERELVSRLLGKLGYRVAVAAGGEEAVAQVGERPVDLLILDMVMPPGIDGAETYRRIREIHPGQRAILLSGLAESARVREAQAQGVGAYLSKPVTLQTLARAVREELDRTP